MKLTFPFEDLLKRHIGAAHNDNNFFAQPDRYPLFQKRRETAGSGGLYQNFLFLQNLKQRSNRRLVRYLDQNPKCFASQFQLCSLGLFCTQAFGD